MKKILMLTLVILLTLTVVACGNATSQNNPSDNNTPPPGQIENPTPTPDNDSNSDTSSGDSNNDIIEQPQSQVPDDVLANGLFDGDLDINGLFAGWGVWIFYNDEKDREYTYEGHWINGMPNGGGTLYIRYGGIEYVTQGNFVNGFAHGSVLLTFTELNVYGEFITWSWDIELDMGQMVNIGVVYSHEILPDNNNEPLELNTAGYGSGTYDLGSVPPWRWYPATISP